MPLDPSGNSASVLAEIYAKHGPIHGSEYDQAAALRQTAAKFVRNDAPPKAAAESITRNPILWHELRGKAPPSREWAIRHWLGMGHVTLLSGRGGIGKSLLGQQIGSALAIGKSFVDQVPQPRTVLMWAAEDDRDELWRRQADLARWLEVDLDAFDEKLIVESYADRDCTLLAPVYGTLIETPMVSELREQVGDYRADYVILDNIARLFGGNENDRHQATTFVATFTGALSQRRAGGLLLGHTARSEGSEFSGSSAWENSVRSRLWLSDRPPDAKSKDGDDEPDTDSRYLARRKANYSAHDLRTMRYRDGVFAIDPAEIGGGVMGHARGQKAERVVVAALQKLIAMGERPSSASGPNNLPKVVMDFKLSEGLTKKELADALRRLMVDGKIKRQVVGAYSNRAPRYGLVEA